MKLIREHCCCPSFLIAVAGPWLCVLGAVFVDYVVVEELTDFIWIGDHPYKDYKVKSVARILASLGKGLAELEEFYKGLPLNNPQPDHQRFFPFIQHYTVEGVVIKFKYQEYLKPKTPESASKALFIATTETEEPRHIIVKFVERYNTEAHRLLAASNHAPELIYYSTDDPDPPNLGGLFMVVMEYVDGQTAHDWYGKQRLPQHIFKQVEEALGILHEQNLVFGDLRQPNIMIKKDERVLLIDFDWCGNHNTNTYPFRLNDDRDPERGIGWHAGVKRGGTMKKEHDVHMLDKMRPVLIS